MLEPGAFSIVTPQAKPLHPTPAPYSKGTSQEMSHLATECRGGLSAARLDSAVPDVAQPHGVNSGCLAGGQPVAAVAPRWCPPNCALPVVLRVGTATSGDV